MAFMTQQRKVTYVLELDEEEAQALRNLFYACVAGTGMHSPRPLGRVYEALCNAGIDPDAYPLTIDVESTRDHGHLVITD